MDLNLMRQKLYTDPSALMIAAKYADVEACKWLVDTGHRVDEITKMYGLSVMHFAAANKRHGAELVKYFERLGCDKEQLDSQLLGPLNYAIAFEAFEVAKELICVLGDPLPDGNLLHLCIINNDVAAAERVHQAGGHFLDQLGVNGENALHVAAANADQRMCDWLINELGLRVDSLSENEEASALHYVGFNHAYGRMLVPYFVDRGLDVCQVDRNNLGPIHYALREKNLSVVCALVQSNANLIYTELPGCRNLVHYCLEEQKLLSIQFLGEHARNLFIGVREGKSIAHWAARISDLDIFKWLVEEAKIDVGPCASGNTVLHYAASNEAFGKTLVPYIHEKLEVDVNAQSSAGETPLMVAIQNGFYEIADELLARGAETKSAFMKCIKLKLLPNAQFLQKKVPALIEEVDFSEAASRSDWPTCEWLVNAGVNPRKCNDGRSALHMVAFNKSNGVALVKKFVSFLNLDVNQRSITGTTPLYYAIQNKNIGVMKQLCKLGANLSARQHAPFNLMATCISLDFIDGARVLYSYERCLIHETGSNGKKAIHVAAEYQNFEFCKWLLKERVDVRAKTHSGKSVIDLVPASNVALLTYFKEELLRSNAF